MTSGPDDERRPTVGADLRRRDERVQLRLGAGTPPPPVGAPARPGRRARTSDVARRAGAGACRRAPVRRQRGPPTGPIEIGAEPGPPVGSGGAAAVRPYAWTRGRTKSGLDLAIEALVSTSQRGREQMAMLQVEHRAVAELCEQTRSVAEVAALL